jgi:hypothetical protein
MMRRDLRSAEAPVDEEHSKIAKAVEVAFERAARLGFDIVPAKPEQNSVAALTPNAKNDGPYHSCR